MSRTNEQTNTPGDPDRLAGSIRFVLICLLLGFSYLNFRATSAISELQRVYANMLEGAALPVLTAFVIRGRLVLLVLSFAYPVAALACLFSRPSPRSFYTIGVLALFTVIQIAIVCTGIFAPLFMLTHQLGGIDSPPQ